MPPAQQRFDAADAAVAAVHLRLVVEIELLAGDGDAQLQVDVVAGADLVADMLGKEAERALPLLLRAVHRHVGVALHVLDVGAILRNQRNADRKAEMYLMLVDDQRQRHEVDQLPGPTRRMGGARR